MATQYKFYLKKDYDQFRSRIIATNSISFKICDYTLAENEKMYMELKEINDVDEDKVYIQMRKKDDNIYVADLLCNKLETYQFRIFTKMPDSDEILEQSAINTFQYQGIIFNEDAIENTAQWGVIQTTLHRLEMTEEELHNVIYKRIEQSDLASEIDDFISENQIEVDKMREDVDNFIAENQIKVNEMREDVDNFIAENQTQVDNLINNSQAEIDEMQNDINTVILQLNAILDEFIEN